MIIVLLVLWNQCKYKKTLFVKNMIHNYICINNFYLLFIVIKSYSLYLLLSKRNHVCYLCGMISGTALFSACAIIFLVFIFPIPSKHNDLLNKINISYFAIFLIKSHTCFRKRIEPLIIFFE